MAAALTAHDDGLCQRLGEAKAIREHGGAIVNASGVMFEVADEQGALDISRVDIVGQPRPASAGPPTIEVIAQPKQKETTAKVPPIEPQSLSAEDFSSAVHTGSGDSGVLDFSKRWRRNGDDLNSVGYEVQRISMDIEEHWRDSGNNASPNVFHHGTWLISAADWAKKLASRADRCAAAFHTARSETPTPDELRTAKLAAQLSVASPVLGFIALMKYRELKNKAIEAGAKYEADVENELDRMRSPLEKPELIAKRVEIPKDLTKGPGQWVSAVRSEKPAWRDYELQATGYPAGMEYEILGPDKVAVDFDGYDPDANLLFEAKGNYEWAVGPDGNFIPGFGPAASFPNTLERQYGVAEATGIPVEWRVAGPKAAEAIQRIVDLQGYGDMITVVVVPAE
ncbi:Tox-REase-5 domain-containing protein [Mycolicibacterium sp. HK-90]|uniref:Tox-REase-5 domain-containing protein n=1 Tax=Mycolicibacterium sp. HK-90 TaxID=3056937 RepID=UPI0026599CFE|nr:Tox-REase-5 domain-containing protein [Mycolicibacterium sp. HK-90]WKG05380.1 Tox-REase-5 domain-containing protein [Mycolicibacterium sp. HK-90]